MHRSSMRRPLLRGQPHCRKKAALFGERQLNGRLVTGDLHVFDDGLVLGLEQARICFHLVTSRANNGLQPVVVTCGR